MKHCCVLVVNVLLVGLTYLFIAVLTQLKIFVKCCWLMFILSKVELLHC